MKSNIINKVIIMLFLAFVNCNNKSIDNTFLVSAGSEGFDECYGIVTDSQNNYVISGVFSKTITFYGDTFKTQLSSNGNLDFFVAKYSTNGKFLWAKQFGSKEDDEVATMSIDEENNLYLTGYCYYSADLFFKEKFEGKKSYLLKLSPNGDVVWANKLKGNGTSEGSSVFIKNKCVFWLSSFNESISDSVKSAELTDIVCTRLNYDGTLLNQKYFGDKGDDIPKDIYVSDNNSIYISCSYSNKPNYTISSATLLELDSGLNQKSLIHLFSDTLSEALSIIVDKDENKYLSGSFTSGNNQDGFVCKLSNHNKKLWTIRYASLKKEWAKGLAFDNEGNIISTVVLNNDAKVSSLRQAIKGFGNYDIYFNKLSKYGEIVKYANFGNIDEEGINKISVENDTLVFCGWFYKTLTINNKKVTSTGEGDVFLGKESIKKILK